MIRVTDYQGQAHDFNDAVEFETGTDGELYITNADNLTLGVWAKNCWQSATVTS